MKWNLSYIACCFILYSSSISMSKAQENHLDKTKDMVKSQIMDRGISDDKILHAFYSVPRHRFVPEARQHLAYEDRAVAIGFGQTISQPYVVAFTLDKLDLKESDKVLEVGTGSGYVAALLSQIVDQVVTIEIIPELGNRAKEEIENLGYENVKIYIGDGYNGSPENAPFDAIIVSAASEEVPQPLLDQLCLGGKLIIPVGRQYEVQKLKLITKTKKGIQSKTIEYVRFVPLVRN